MNTIEQLKADKLAAEEDIRDILMALWNKYQCEIELTGGTCCKRSIVDAIRITSVNAKIDITL